MSESNKVEITPALSIIIAGLIVAGAILFTHFNPVGAPQKQAEVQGGEASPSVRMPSQSEHIVGSASAPIVLIEYSDFECPYCSVVHPTIKQIVSGSNGQIAWVYRHLPLTSIHPDALPAADAAECITAQLGNDAFWKFADSVFANQKNLNAAYTASLAKTLGADMTKYNACVAARTYANKIDQDITEAMNNGGNGTPYTVIVNTKTKKQVAVSGALPYAQFMQAIQSVQ